MSKTLFNDRSAKNTIPPSFVLSAFSTSTLLSLTQLFADWQGTCLLYSGSDLDAAQASLLGLFPFETVTVHGQHLCYQKGGQVEHVVVHNPWEGLLNYFFKKLEQEEHAIALGWLGYGMGAFADPDSLLAYRPSPTPDAYWQRCAILLDVDQHTQQAHVYIDASALQYVEERAKEWIHKLAEPSAWQALIEQLPTVKQEGVSAAKPPLFDCANRRMLYLEKIEQIKEEIRAGEVYQVNLSQEFLFQSPQHPFALFRQACQLNPAPFSAYFCFEQMKIICTSPERFLCKKGEELETRPIKGTIRRGKTPEEDLLLKQFLLTSTKERAELLMITDLMRNDLGKISQIGSVKTVELWRCEAYTNVFHLISIIQSRAQEGLKPLEIVRSCFPGGSITGCPKGKAMALIDALEKRPRGIYTGSIGYFTGQGDFDLNIAIRTLVAHDSSFSLQLGGGIVIDSDPEQEYQETLVKGASLFRVLQTPGWACT